MSYTVKFVDNETFERLPYKKVATSVGVADRNAGVAYVRDTGNPMDVFTAYHELEHLKGDDLHEYESPGEDGIYYKDFGQVVSNILPAVGGFFTGGPVGGALGAAGSFFGGKGNKGQSQQPQHATMNQFNPSVSMAPPSPATSQVGGQSAGQDGGGLGAGTINKVRDFMKQRSSGFYSGRDAGAL